LVREFSHIFVYNLRGNQRTAGEQSRQEGGKVFGGGSRATIAVSIFVRRLNTTADAELDYFEVADYLSTPEKLHGVASARDIEGVSWLHLTPNPDGDWALQRDPSFATYLPLGDKSKNPARSRVFTTYSAGLKTNRDAWVYSYSQSRLEANVERLLDTYSRDLARWDEAGRPPQLSGFLERDPSKISWDGTLEAQLSKNSTLMPNWQNIRVGLYRPFNKQQVYFSRELNNSVYRLPQLFTGPESTSIGFYYVGMGSAVPFSVLMTDVLPDLHVTGAGSGGQFFPQTVPVPAFDSGDQLEMPTAEAPDLHRLANVSDDSLHEYRKIFGNTVTKDDIFYYVYGILHSPDYRERYAADLKKMLPRIPKVKQFAEFAEAGRKLADLHINYETVTPYPLAVSIRPTAGYSTTGGSTGEDDLSPEQLRVTKMRFAGKRPNIDKSTIIYNDEITLSGIPAEAHDYMLGSRSAVEWILERYQIKTDKPSGIVNDPNDWGLEHGNPRYILDLLKSIVTVSVETVKIVNSLPPLEILEES
jgi:predicted helicase